MTLSVYADDFNMAGPEVNMKMAWSLICGVSAMGLPTRLGTTQASALRCSTSFLQKRLKRHWDMSRFLLSQRRATISTPSPASRRRLPPARSEGQQGGQYQA